MRVDAKRQRLGLGPVVVGVASLVTAATGAVALQPATSNALAAAGGGIPTITSDGLRAGLNSMAQARQQASERADRAQRASVRLAAKQEKTAERHAWQRHRAKEIAQVEKRAKHSVTVPRIIDRNIRWTLPVSSYHLSAGFGSSGSHWVSTHTGQDFAAPMGTPIRSVGDGEVISAAYDGAYGNKIEVQLEDGTVTWYCHLSAYEVRSGPVRAGQVIGYLGSTGNSTGPHMHFEVHPGGGDAIDPMPWLREHGLDP